MNYIPTMKCCGKCLDGRGPGEVYYCNNAVCSCHAQPVSQEGCRDCSHGLCVACGNNCHNKPCVLFCEPVKSCFDQLLPKNSIPVALEEVAQKVINDAVAMGAPLADFATEAPTVHDGDNCACVIMNGGYLFRCKDNPEATEDKEGKGWEEEFDERFGLPDACLSYDAVKSFIRTLLAKVAEESRMAEREEVLNFMEHMHKMAVITKNLVFAIEFAQQIEHMKEALKKN